MDFKTGTGTGKLGEQLRELQQAHSDLSQAAMEESGFTMASIREYVMNVTKNQGLVLSVINYEKAIAFGKPTSQERRI